MNQVTVKHEHEHERSLDGKKQRQQKSNEKEREVPKRKKNVVVCPMKNSKLKQTALTPFRNLEYEKKKKFFFPLFCVCIYSDLEHRAWTGASSMEYTKVFEMKTAPKNKLNLRAARINCEIKIRKVHAPLTGKITRAPSTKRKEWNRKLCHCFTLSMILGRPL